jgi:hypothetical protein
MQRDPWPTVARLIPSRPLAAARQVRGVPEQVALPLLPAQEPLPSTPLAPPVQSARRSKRTQAVRAEPDAIPAPTTTQDPKPSGYTVDVPFDDGTYAMDYRQIDGKWTYDPGWWRHI